MNHLEERLKDAYLGATQTVRPDAIRGLDEQAATITGRHRKQASRLLYWAAPLAAAAAVAVIAIVLGVGAKTPTALPSPHHHRPTHHTVVAPAGSPAERFFIALSNGSKRIYIINSTSGVTVASLTPSSRWDFFGTPATGDGVTYVIPTWQPGHCGSTMLEQFTLSSSGQPGPLTELTSLRHLVSHLWMSDVAVSADNSTLAFFANTCVSRFVAGNPHIGVIKLATRQITNWSTPDKSIEYPMSLTRNGHLLEYNSGGLLAGSPSAIYQMPTNAPPGPVDGVSSTLLTGNDVGSDTSIEGAMMTSNDAHVFLYTLPTANRVNATSFKLWELTVATRRLKLIGSYRGGQPLGALAIDPAARRAIAALNNASQAIMINLRNGRQTLLSPPNWQIVSNGGYAW